MGEFVLKRENTIALLQKVTSNDTSIMVVGQEQKTCMACNNDGIVDDLKKIYVATPTPINRFWILNPDHSRECENKSGICPNTYLDFSNFRYKFLIKTVSCSQMNIL